MGGKSRPRPTISGGAARGGSLGFLRCVAEGFGLSAPGGDGRLDAREQHRGRDHTPQLHPTQPHATLRNLLIRRSPRCELGEAAQAVRWPLVVQMLGLGQFAVDSERAVACSCSIATALLYNDKQSGDVDTALALALAPQPWVAAGESGTGKRHGIASEFSGVTV